MLAHKPDSRKQGNHRGLLKYQRELWRWNGFVGSLAKMETALQVITSRHNNSADKHDAQIESPLGRILEIAERPFLALDSIGQRNKLTESLSRRLVV